MDTAARLRRWALGLALLVVALAGGSARAAGSVSPGPQTTYTITDTVVKTGSTAAGVCAIWVPAYQAYLNGLNANNQYVITVGTVTENACGYSYRLNGGSPVTSSAGIGKSSPVGCPANSTGNGTTPPTSCTCAANFQPNAGATACVAIPDKCAPTLAQPLASEVSVPMAGKQVPSSVCVGGCAYIPAGAAAAGAGFWTTLNGAYTYRSPGENWIGSGTSCTGAPVGSQGTPTNPPTPDPSPAPPGKCKGTVNGAEVVVDCTGTSSTSGGGTGSVAGTSGAASGAQGAGGTATSPTTTASSPPGTIGGTSSTSSQTTCTGTLCTTTTTTANNNPNGTTTTTSTSGTVDKGTFCKDNPGDPNCAGSKGSFEGSCAATKCEGDAITCQIAKEQAKRNCEFFDPASSDHPAVVAAAAGIHPSDHPWSTATSQAVPTIDQTNILGAGCPADMSVSVSHFGAVSIPFSSMCAPAAMLGNILVALTALTCIGIIFVRGK